MARLNWTGDVGWSYTDERGNAQGITAERVQADLDSLAGQPLEVEISTYGGDFDHAARIYDMVKAYPGKKSLYLSATVASAGTLIMLAFPKETTYARAFTRFGIHNAQGFVMGDYNDMRAQADHFQKMSDMVAQEYASRTGKSIEEVKTLMDDDSWFFGQEIVDEGFAGAIDDYGTATLKLSASPSARMAVKKEFRERAQMWAGRGPSAEFADKIMSASKSNAAKLIKSGDVNTTDAWTFTAAEQDKMLGTNGDDWATYKLWHLVQDDAEPQNTKARFKYPYGKNGKVYRSALRSIASRAAQNNLQELSDWASAMIKQIDAKGENHVNKEEVIAWLKANPGVDLVELAAAAGRTVSVVTEEHTAALALRKQFADLKVTDPLAQFKANQEALLKVDTDRVDNELDARFGKAKHADGKENLLRAHAASFFKGTKFEGLEAKVAEFKKDPIAIQLAGQSADYRVGFAEPSDKKPVETSYRGIPSREV